MMIADFETQITVNGNAKKAEVKDRIKHEI